MDNAEANKQIGQRIARVRNQSQLRECDLAERVGIELELFRRFEAGESPISAIELRNVARALDMPIEFFTHEDGPLLDWFGEWQVMHTFRKLDPASQKHVIRFLTDLAGDVRISHRVRD